MEQNSKTDKGLLFFYDWEECFDSLSDKECKEMLMAMLRFKKYKTPPPEFTGVCKIIASLIFPQIERQIQDFENGKKGGRPKKEQDKCKNNNEETKSSSHPDEGDELLKLAMEKRKRQEREWANRHTSW